MKTIKKVKVNAKLAKRNFSRLETQDKIGVTIFTGVMSLLAVVVVSWIDSGMNSFYGF